MFKNEIEVIYKNQLEYIEFLQSERKNLIERQEYLEYTEFFPKLKTLDSMLKESLEGLIAIKNLLEK